jgi:DNA-binding transcriptional LysR family regulator
LAGLGIADLPAYLVADDLRLGRLESVLDDYMTLDRTVYAVYPSGGAVSPRVREFVKLLLSHFADEGIASAAPRPRSAGGRLLRRADAAGASKTP